MGRTRSRGNGLAYFGNSFHSADSAYSMVWSSASVSSVDSMAKSTEI